MSWRATSARPQHPPTSPGPELRLPPPPPPPRQSLARRRVRQRLARAASSRRHHHRVPRRHAREPPHRLRQGRRLRLRLRLLRHGGDDAHLHARHARDRDLDLGKGHWPHLLARALQQMLGSATSFRRYAPTIDPTKVVEEMRWRWRCACLMYNCNIKYHTTYIITIKRHAVLYCTLAAAKSYAGCA